MRFSYMVTRNYQLHSLEGRRNALFRTLKVIKERFDDGEKLNHEDSLLWVHSVADVMMLLSDLAAVAFAVKGPLSEFGQRMSRMTSSKVRGVFQQIVNGQARANGERLWNMVNLSQRAEASELVGRDELLTIEKSVADTLDATEKSLRAIARIYLRHEQLLHQVKHSPWKIISDLQNDERGNQVVAVVIDDRLWEMSNEGVLLLPVSIEMWNLWAFAVEEANLLIQVALNNIQLRIEVCDAFVPPITICTTDKQLKQAYLEISQKLMEAPKRADIQLQIKIVTKVTEGGWLDQQGKLWDRLAAESWPLEK